MTYQIVENMSSVELSRAGLMCSEIVEDVEPVQFCDTGEVKCLELIEI